MVHDLFCRAIDLYELLWLKKLRYMLVLYMHIVYIIVWLYTLTDSNYYN